ncbi:SDR family NAD(P)-dependent oxidoreductase [Leptolyngbya sp. FACHB-261]|uniref:SDR family NAD(P)-dependent oxidoreductase n=1 Tax=Leptolyngbya sp. FACHB-261 TaxID=2692806 RepID=UPI0016879FA5|nr:SDR family NAD(P)-dependent oxidoreductase [Leptolyngbya sp. FACHB-261]
MIISSVNDLVSKPFLAVYSASKGAVVILTKEVALDDAKQKVWYKVLCIGFAAWRLLPLKQLNDLSRFRTGGVNPHRNITKIE